MLGDPRKGHLEMVNGLGEMCKKLFIGWMWREPCKGLLHGLGFKECWMRARVKLLTKLPIWVRAQVQVRGSGKKKFSPFGFVGGFVSIYICKNKIKSHSCKSKSLKLSHSIVFDQCQMLKINIKYSLINLCECCK